MWGSTRATYLGLHLEHEPQDAVGARVLRAEVEQHLLGVRRRAGRRGQFGDFGHRESPVAGGPSYGMFLVARSGWVGGGPSAPKGFSSSL